MRLFVAMEQFTFNRYHSHGWLTESLEQAEPLEKVRDQSLEDSAISLTETLKFGPRKEPRHLGDQPRIGPSVPQKFRHF